MDFVRLSELARSLLAHFDYSFADFFAGAPPPGLPQVAFPLPGAPLCAPRPFPPVPVLSLMAELPPPTRHSAPRV